MRKLICKIFGHQDVTKINVGGHKHCEFCYSCLPEDFVRTNNKLLYFLLGVALVASIFLMGSLFEMWVMSLAWIAIK